MVCAVMTFEEMSLGKDMTVRRSSRCSTYWQPPRKPKLSIIGTTPRGGKKDRNKEIISEFLIPSKAFLKVAEKQAPMQAFLEYKLELLIGGRCIMLQRADSQGELTEEHLCHERKSRSSFLPSRCKGASKVERKNQVGGGSGISSWCLRMNPQLKPD